MDFLNSKTGLKNIHVIGPMQVVRASISYEWDPDLMETVEANGWAAVLTEVVDWPFEEDDAEVPFPGDIYGVRTRCWRRPLADGGGDMEWWTAVPKSLPGDYTETLRYSHLTSGFYEDYLGSDPFAGTTWNARTPTGLVLNTTTDPDGYRALWTPMNLNQQVLDVSISDIFSGQWVYYEDGSGNILFVVAQLDASHVGFRGGKLKVTLGSPWPDFPTAGSKDLEIVAIPMDKFWNPADCDAGDQPEVVGSVTVSWAGWPTPPGPGPVEIDIDLPAMIPTAVGIPFIFMARYEYDLSSIMPIYRTSHEFRLSPRVDIPLWYSASMGNKCVPGGYIEPP